MKVVFAERARRDIADIYDSLEQHNPSAAQRVEDAIRAGCERLGDFPYAAPATDEPNCC
jgi:plasmid stabilization system protein ParE